MPFVSFAGKRDGPFANGPYISVEVHSGMIALTTSSIARLLSSSSVRDQVTATVAARRGEIPVIRIGKKLRVPVCRLERMLEESQ